MSPTTPIVAPPPPPPARRPSLGPRRSSSDSSDHAEESPDTGQCEPADLPLRAGETVRTYTWSSKASTGRPSLVVLCFHGAGDTGLSWAAAARRLVADPRLHGAPVVAADLRGHGETSVGDGDHADLSVERLTEDALLLVAAVSDRYGGADVVLAGHSLGGAIATRAAVAALKGDPPLPVRAVLLLDAVEGTAVEGLPQTAAWLRGRPSSFRSCREAAAWALSSGMLQSARAARLSVPSRLRWDEAAQAFVWRADVAGAERFWRGWFEGLSEMFVGLSLPKLLVVGGVDRLDGALEAAHMRGRFRMDVVPHTGHQVHEDRPAEVAEVLAGFLASVQRQQAAFERVRAASPAGQKRSRLEGEGAWAPATPTPDSEGDLSTATRPGGSTVEDSPVDASDLVAS